MWMQYLPVPVHGNFMRRKLRPPFWMALTCVIDAPGGLTRHSYGCVGVSGARPGAAVPPGISGYAGASVG